MDFCFNDANAAQPTFKVTYRDNNGAVQPVGASYVWTGSANANAAAPYKLTCLCSKCRLV